MKALLPSCERSGYSSCHTPMPHSKHVKNKAITLSSLKIAFCQNFWWRANPGFNMFGYVNEKLQFAFLKIQKYVISWWYCRAVHVQTAGARDILGTRFPLTFIPTFPTGYERTARSRLPYIVNADFSCSSQPFCLPWAKNRGHTLPEKKKTRMKSRLRLAAGHTHRQTVRYFTAYSYNLSQF